MQTESQETGRKPATAAIRSAGTAKAITDGEIVLATIDVPGTPERAPARARALKKPG